MRWNLVADHGQQVADQFLDCYRAATGNTCDDQPYWDLVSLRPTGCRPCETASPTSNAGASRSSTTSSSPAAPRLNLIAWWRWGRVRVKCLCICGEQSFEVD